MAAHWFDFLTEHWPEYAAVTASASIYILIDIHPQVKSLRALVRTFSFYILWIVFIVLNLMAFGALQLAWGKKIQELAGSMSFLTIVVLSTIGALGILQSMTVKLAGTKFVDVEKMIDSYRSTVLAHASQKDAELKRREADDLAEKLSTKYEQDPSQLRTDYVQVMGWAGSDDKAIVEAFEQIKATATTLGIKFERVLANRMAATDPVMVKAMTKRQAKSKS